MPNRHQAKVPEISDLPSSETSLRRSDARRNIQKLLDAAAALFVTSGVDVPVREIALKAEVGMGTIYRHFPTSVGVKREEKQERRVKRRFSA